MSAHGLGSLGRLLVDPGPCPICDLDDGECTHHLYGEDHYRIGDPRSKHPKLAGPEVEAPKRKKGRRQRPSTIQGPQGPSEDRAHHPEANRQA